MAPDRRARLAGSGGGGRRGHRGQDGLKIYIILVSAPDPDPPDPHVFGPPGYGSGSFSQRCGSGSVSGSFYHQAKIVRICTLDSYCFVTFLDFLSLKNDVNEPSKSNKQKKCWCLEGQ